MSHSMVFVMNLVLFSAMAQAGEPICHNKIDYCGENVYFEVNLAITENLRSLAKKLKVTVYSILLTTYYLLLRAYSFQDDIVIGTPIANRHHEQTESRRDGQRRQQ